MFRALATAMYSSLDTPSCNGRNRLERRALLESELSAVDRFEKRLEATPAWSHLLVARQDARYRLIRENGCWADDSPKWAQLHVEMTKAVVAETLPRLGALAQSLRPLPIDPKGIAGAAPAFRYLTRNLLLYIDPGCSVVASASNKEVFRSVADAVANLKEDLAGTPFSAQFAISEADAAYEKSSTIVECAEPANASLKHVQLEAAANARRQIASIRAIMISR